MKKDKKRTEHHMDKDRQKWMCKTGNAKISLDPQCKAFNYQNDKKLINNVSLTILFPKNLTWIIVQVTDQFKATDEIVLVPKDRSRPPRACFKEKTAIRHSTNKAETSVGWCGTCDPTAKINSKERERWAEYLTVILAPGYCGKDADSSKKLFSKLFNLKLINPIPYGLINKLNLMGADLIVGKHLLAPKAPPLKTPQVLPQLYALLPA